jgi:outer membrane protein assembly factor BamE (lipoprotein component of BamABCDE complex)
MKANVKPVLWIVVAAQLAGCQTPAEHAAAVRQAQDGDKLTVGTVQREIHVGMSSADVVGVLGAPNMVTTDDQRNETWVYDKISTDTVYSSSTGGVNALVLGGALVGGLVGGAAGGNYASSAGAKSTSQRTLTIIVKFDGVSRVRDFAYRSSSF